MMPPFRTPGNASNFGSGFHSATTASPSGKLRMRRPSGLDGPQPQQALSGAYFSWSDLSLLAAALYFFAPLGETPLYGRISGPV